MSTGMSGRPLERDLIGRLTGLRNRFGRGAASEKRALLQQVVGRALQVPG